MPNDEWMNRVNTCDMKIQAVKTRKYYQKGSITTNNRIHHRTIQEIRHQNQNTKQKYQLKYWIITVCHGKSLSSPNVVESTGRILCWSSTLHTQRVPCASIDATYVTPEFREHWSKTYSPRIRDYICSIYVPIGTHHSFITSHERRRISLVQSTTNKS